MYVWYTIYVTKVTLITVALIQMMTCRTSAHKSLPYSLTALILETPGHTNGCVWEVPVFQRTTGVWKMHTYICYSIFYIVCQPLFFKIFLQVSCIFFYFSIFKASLSRWGFPWRFWEDFELTEVKGTMLLYASCGSSFIVSHPCEYRAEWIYSNLWKPHE